LCPWTNPEADDVMQQMQLNYISTLSSMSDDRSLQLDVTPPPERHFQV